MGIHSSRFKCLLHGTQVTPLGRYRNQYSNVKVLAAKKRARGTNRRGRLELEWIRRSIYDRTTVLRRRVSVKRFKHSEKSGILFMNFPIPVPERSRPLANCVIHPVQTILPPTGILALFVIHCDNIVSLSLSLYNDIAKQYGRDRKAESKRCKLQRTLPERSINTQATRYFNLRIPELKSPWPPAQATRTTRSNNRLSNIHTTQRYKDKILITTALYISPPQPTQLRHHFSRRIHERQ